MNCHPSLRKGTLQVKPTLRSARNGCASRARRSPSSPAVELDDLVAQLRAAQEENGEIASSDPLPAAPENASGSGRENALVRELARLYHIERAIMAAPAHSIVGLGVKARHAAYVMSQYWEEPIDKIDWEAQAIRLLIDAVCDVARNPLPFRTRGS
jgi:hypothetical protein